MLINRVIYRNGKRVEGLGDLEMAGDFLWLGLASPTLEEFLNTSKEFGFHPLAIEDAVKANQRPKLEEYDNLSLLVVKTVEMVKEQVSSGELLLFIGENFLVVVRHGEALPLSKVRVSLESRPEILKHGPWAAAYAIVDHVIDSYIDLTDLLESRVGEIEELVFSAKRENHAEEIYYLKREIVKFRNLMDPLLSPLQKVASLEYPKVSNELYPFFRETLDHLSKAIDLCLELESLLTSALTADLAHLQVRQNEDMRKITAYVALGVTPTTVAGIYGMNFKHMPELEMSYSYPVVILSLVVVTGYLIFRFKKAGWL